MQLRFLIFAFLLLISVAFWWHASEQIELQSQRDTEQAVRKDTNQTHEPVEGSELIPLTINDTNLQVSVADDVEERMLGLSGTPALAVDMGKLFVFEELGPHGIWMKDMNYPIDVLWLDASYTIVHIVQRFMPESYENRVVEQSPVPAQYVLEVNAGVVESEGWEVGDQVILEKNLH